MPCYVNKSETFVKWGCVVYSRATWSGQISLLAVAGCNPICWQTIYQFYYKSYFIKILNRFPKNYEKATQRAVSSQMLYWLKQALTFFSGKSDFFYIYCNCICLQKLSTKIQYNVDFTLNVFHRPSQIKCVYCRLVWRTWNFGTIDSCFSSYNKASLLSRCLMYKDYYEVLYIETNVKERPPPLPSCYKQCFENHCYIES